VKKTSVWLWVAAALAIVVGLASYRYLPLGLAAAPQNVAANQFAATGALVAHAGIAATALILGALQFFPGLRARWPTWHRRAGTVYVICCLISGAAGLLLAFGVSTGPIAAAGFGTLAVVWIFCTANAWRYARARDFVRHQRWMIRSYAMTFGAVTLRLYLPIILATHMDFATGYRAIAWLAWVPNLILVELWMRRRTLFRTSPPRAAPSQSPG
jgi:uncharacterized membrane protein